MVDEGSEIPTINPSTMNEARQVQYGRIYDNLEPNKPIDIMVLGEGKLIIDEENLDLGAVNRESLLKAWESEKDKWTARCEELKIDIDPFKVFTYYQIQRKAYQILGAPTTDKLKERRAKYHEQGTVPLSQMKGMAMCSEYAVLEAYIAQKIGEPTHLIVGTAIVGEEQWREAHMFTWIDDINAVLEGTLAAENEYPALMRPTNNETRQTLENGYDVKCQRVGTNQTAIYGLEAGGFGAKFKPKVPQTLQEAANL